MTPTPRTLWMIGAGLPVALLPALVHPGLWPSWLTVILLCVLLPAVDALRAVTRSRLRVEITAPERLFVGRGGVIGVTVGARGRSGFVPVRVRLELGGPVAPFLEARGILGPVDETFDFEIVPRRRAQVRVRELWIQWQSPWGLVQRSTRRSVDLERDVLPDLILVRDHALRYLSSTDPTVGQHVKRRLGGGSEFDSIREFTPGMDPRALHWKASARHRKLLVREFRAERDQQVVLAIDCGHLMAEPLSGIPRLDHAVNAGLLLAWIGLRYGDRVGLYGFDARPRIFFAPRAGMGSFPRLQAGAAQLEYRPDETNFTLSLAHLSTQLRHRSLIVVLTDFVDSITAELMVENLRRVARRHLVLFVALRDPELARLAERPPGSMADVARAVIADEMLHERDVVLKRLDRAGVLTLDVQPQRLSSRLVNRYLEVKQREMIA